MRCRHRGILYRVLIQILAQGEERRPSDIHSRRRSSFPEFAESAILPPAHVRFVFRHLIFPKRSRAQEGASDPGCSISPARGHPSALRISLGFYTRSGGKARIRPLPWTGKKEKISFSFFCQKRRSCCTGEERRDYICRGSTLSRGPQASISPLPPMMHTCFSAATSSRISAKAVSSSGVVCKISLRC